MRPWFVMAFCAALLAGCSCSCPTPPQATVVVPQGAAVVCPNGSPAVVNNGAYRC
jgi:uncharacterized Zn-binding protein involved in type VI secretion